MGEGVNFFERRQERERALQALEKAKKVCEGKPVCRLKNESVEMDKIRESVALKRKAREEKLN